MLAMLSCSPPMIIKDNAAAGGNASIGACLRDRRFAAIFCAGHVSTCTPARRTPGRKTAVHKQTFECIYKMLRDTVLPLKSFSR